MDIKGLYQALSYGVLQNLSMSGEGSGDIMEAKRPQVIQAANEALLRIYSRFNLREKDCIIAMQDGVTNYHLRKRFAVMTEPRVEKRPYIIDLPLEPFEEDVIKVLAVYTSTGKQLVLNDEDQSFSVFTPQDTVLQVPRPITGAALSVTYQARHVTLDHTKLDQPIEIPAILEGALFAHIGFTIFTNMGTAEQQAKGMTHFENFTAICDGIDDRGQTTVNISSLVQKFEKRGFC